MSRALYHETTLIDEQTNNILFDDTARGGSINDVNRVYYEYAPGNSILVWQKAIILDIPDGSDNFDVETFIADNNPYNRENIILRVLPGYIIGNLTIPNTIPSNINLELYNYGEIQGDGGKPAQNGMPWFGKDGKTALILERPIKVINNGYIRGGGGAGGLGLGGYRGYDNTAERVYCDHWWPDFDLKKDRFRGGWKTERIDANTAWLVSPCKKRKIITMPDTGPSSTIQDTIVDSGVLDGTQYEVHTAVEDPNVWTSVFVAVKIFSNSLVSYYTESITGLPGGLGGHGGKGVGFDNQTGPDLGEPGELGSKYTPIYPQGVSLLYAPALGYSGTWTVPAGVTEIKLYAVGFGGKGEDSTDYSKGGWAGEEHVETYQVTPGDTYSWTLGNGSTRSGITSFIGPDINISLSNGSSYSYGGSNTEAEMDDWDNFYVNGYDFYGLPRKYHHGYPQNSHSRGRGGGEGSIFGHGGSPIERSTSDGGIGAGGSAETYGGRGHGGDGLILIKWNDYKELRPNDGEDGAAGGTGGDWGVKGNDGSPTIRNTYYNWYNYGTNPGYSIIGWSFAESGSVQGNINGQVLD